jgi:hypothetical protein
LESYTEANLNRLSNDVHLLAAPFRFILRSLLWLAVLLLAPAIFFSVLLFAVFYHGADKSDTVWFLKWGFGVLAPFVSSFWFLLAVMLPKFYRARDGYEVENTFGLHARAIGGMAFAFATTAAALPYVARALYEASDAVWFSGAYLALLLPFLLLGFWRLLTYRR